MPFAYSYPEAVHYAAEAAMHSPQLGRRTEQLRELLYGLGSTIPEAWSTSTRGLLSRRETCIERLLDGIRADLGSDHESYRYQVLGSILQLALMVKQTASHVS